MIDREYNMDTYKSVKKSIGAVMRKTKLLKFVLDYHKTKKMYKYAVKKLPFVIRCVPDKYKTR